MRFTVAFVAILGLALAAPNSPKPRLLTDSFIESINARQNQWVAKRQFPEDTPLEHFKTLASLKGFSRTNEKLPLKLHQKRADLPKTFDAREQWPNCPSIGAIRDQGHCGSCWAFGAVESMSDRLCIAQGVQFTFSPEELVSCCTANWGCSGGWLIDAWNYWNSNGIVSGGDQDSQQGCRPYTSAVTGETPSCQRECASTYNKTYSEDLRFGISAYTVQSNVEAIQQELYENGPLEVSFDVYEDFPNYESGVYEYTTGEYLGGHAVKLLGWGEEENGTPYWLVANSWNADWGMKGFFKFRRGSNECNIESDVVGGIAK